jgi:hypothetical protein
LLVGAWVLVARVSKRPAVDAAAAPAAASPTETAVSVGSTSPAAPSDVPFESPSSGQESPPGTPDSSHAVLVVSCNPPCDSVFVDGHPVAHAERGVSFPPGVHMVGANLAHHASKVQPILLRRGHVERLEVAF